MTINEVAKAGSASWTGNYSLIWSGLTFAIKCNLMHCGSYNTDINLSSYILIVLLHARLSGCIGCSA